MRDRRRKNLRERGSDRELVIMREREREREKNVGRERGKLERE